MTPIENTPDATNTEASVQGRSVFIVETTAAGIAVKPGFLSEQNQIMQLPMVVFPDLSYGLQQIDELRALVIAHFSKAAQVGLKVMAEQNASNEAGENVQTADSDGQ